MTTVEVTTTATSNEPRLLSLRVTPEQEIAIYAFFQINGWTIITEEVPKNCETCQRSINGEDVDPPMCTVCQKSVDNEANKAETSNQATMQQPTILHVQDQGGRKVVVVGNAMTMSGQQNQNQVVVTSKSSDPTLMNIVKTITNKPVEAKQVVDPQPKIYNVNNSADNRPYQCDDCGKHFRKKSHVIAHMKFHSGEALPKCNVCGKEFLYKHNLISHATIHSGERPFQCNMCPKNFRRKDDLQVHIRTHTGERPYKCDICGKCFTTQNQLPKHKRTHTGEKPYQCGDCNKCFRTKPHLEKHYRTHSGERPFKCEECGRAFTQNAHLMAHYRIHSGEKPFECDVCHKCFKESKTLKKHKDIHIKGMPYNCHICDKGFLRQQNLEVHMCVHSDDEPKYKRKLREKREMLERLQKESEMAESAEVVQEEGVSEEMDQALGVTVIDADGQTFRVVENGEMSTEQDEGNEQTEESKSKGQGQNMSNSIASSLLTLVEMITSADQGGKDGEKIQPNTSRQKEAGTLETVVVTTAAGSGESTTITGTVQSEDQNQVPEVVQQNIVISRMDDGVQMSGISQEQQSALLANVQQLIPSSQVATLVTTHGGATEVPGISVQDGEVVIAEVDGTGEQIVGADQFVDGETFVMEVQYVDEG